MRRAARLDIVLLLALVVATSACQLERDCRPGTILLSASLAGVPEADSVRVTFTLAGAETRHTELERSGQRDVETIEITFPSGYPAGQPATVALVALRDGVVVAHVESSFVLVPGCTHFGLLLAAEANDDAAPPPPPPDLAPPECVPATHCPPAVACGQVSDGCGGTLLCGTCQLTAVVPPLAKAASTVVLEGTFHDPAVVHFSGGVTAPATLLGPHRATVVVPADAGSGDLTVETAGASVGPLPFRRASFALGLGRFYSAYDQASGARQMPSLVHPRTDLQTAVIGDFLYVFGGNHGDPVDEVERATINADGTLSAFAVLPGVVPAQRRNLPTSVVVGRSIYVIGGDSAGSVERADVGADGTLSPFALVPSTLRHPRYRASSVVIGDSVYVIGGISQAGDVAGILKSVERATIQPDGTLSSFAVVPGVSLRSPRRSAPCFVRGRSLYVVGGTIDLPSTVETATIGGDGSLSDFSVLRDVQLEAGGRSGFSLLVLGDSIYVAGGLGDGSIERASFDANGVLSTFKGLGYGLGLRAEHNGLRLEVVGNYVYAIGGYDPSPWARNPYSGLERASINASGELAPFTYLLERKTTKSRNNPIILVAGRYLYLVAGDFDTTVERSTIAADGTLSAFTAVPEVKLALELGRMSACSAVIGRWLYLIGGDFWSDGPDTIERAAIADDGTLSTFELVPGVHPNRTRSGHSCFVYAGRLFLVGGNSATDPDIERADIGTGGSITNFVPLTGGNLTAPTGAWLAPALFEDTIYLLGSDGPGSPGSQPPRVQRGVFTSATYLFGFGSDPNVMMGLGRSSPAALVLGPRVLVFGGYTGQRGPSPLEYASISWNDVLSTFDFLPETTTETSDLGAVGLGNQVYLLGPDSDSVGVGRAEMR